MSRELGKYILVVVTASALALPAVAKQNSSSNSAQASAQPAATASMAATSTGSKADELVAHPLPSKVRQGFWGRLNPFARKSFVQHQMQPIRDRTDELAELTAENAHDITALNAQAQAGIRAAQDRADRANQLASSASQRAEQAYGEAGQLTQQVSQINTQVQNADQYQVAQTAELHFRPGFPRLNRSSSQRLDQFLNGLSGQKGYIVEVESSAAGRGLAAIHTSRQLSAAVVRHLVLQDGIPLYRIYASGLGNAGIPGGLQGRPRRLRRGGVVEIRILRNSLAPAAAAATPASPQGGSAE